MHLQVSHTPGYIGQSQPCRCVAVTFLFTVININDFSVRDHNEIFDVCNDFHPQTCLPPFEPCTPPLVPQAHPQMEHALGSLSKLFAVVTRSCSTVRQLLLMSWGILGQVWSWFSVVDWLRQVVQSLKMTRQHKNFQCAVH